MSEPTDIITEEKIAEVKKDLKRLRKMPFDYYRGQQIKALERILEKAKSSI